MKEPVTVFTNTKPDKHVPSSHYVEKPHKFSAVRISQKDNVVFPDRLTIDNEKVVFYKGKLIGYDTTSIMRESIGGVSISAHILFADIVIETAGGQRIVAEGFSKPDARAIKKLLSE